MPGSLNFARLALVLWRCVAKVEVSQSHRQPHLAGPLRLELCPDLDHKCFRCFQHVQVRGLLPPAEPQALRTTVRNMAYVNIVCHGCFVRHDVNMTLNDGRRLSTGSNDSTVTGASSLPPFEVEWNEAASAAIMWSLPGKFIWYTKKLPRDVRSATMLQSPSLKFLRGCQTCKGSTLKSFQVSTRHS